MFAICYSFKVIGRKREELKEKHKEEMDTFETEVNLNTSCFGLMTYDLVNTIHVSVVLKQPEIKRSKSKVEIQSL